MKPMNREACDAVVRSCNFGTAFIVKTFSDGVPTYCAFNAAGHLLGHTSRRGHFHLFEEILARRGSGDGFFGTSQTSHRPILARAQQLSHSMRA